ncbi:hypothetical protein F2Q68_00034442 [Brassica cretica]|uniref:Uncharacterized protein n=1 Tax=Brassica cretica TaxID=69181 RepID=A0A8S9N3D2_BRACR|nr:hypothetical protein F2Q68_00034442 [Brassica cretica]KAF3489806.1 hypothetical protein F2Q69_00053230 [Brassica cretica]
MLTEPRSMVSPSTPWTGGDTLQLVSPFPRTSCRLPSTLATLPFSAEIRSELESCLGGILALIQMISPKTRVYLTLQKGGKWEIEERIRR